MSQHGEKLAFVAVILVVGFLFYRGTKLPGLGDDKTTEALDKEVSRAKNVINSKNSWDGLAKKRVAPAEYVAELEKQSKIAIQMWEASEAALRDARRRPAEQ